MGLRIGQVSRALYCEFFVAMENLSIGPELQVERWDCTYIRYKPRNWRYQFVYEFIDLQHVASDTCHNFFYQEPVEYPRMLKKS
jgi:hypothetical protein